VTTVATDVLLLLHVPPPPSANAVAEPAQIFKAPVIAPGIGLTVTTTEVLHVPDRLYVIVVVSTEFPVATPVPGSTVATAVLLLVHVPPPPSINDVVAPAQTLSAPVIGAGDVFTVTVVVAFEVHVITSVTVNV
jgi:hypothetical protein